MAFEWNRMYKWEENHERNITEDVEEYICEHYGIEGVLDMTEDQFKEVEAFFMEMNEFSVMRQGFNTVVNNWLDYREEEGLV
jgi:hypothetical protein